MRHSRLFIASFLLLGLFSQTQASIIYVNKSATGANNGSTWADAYKELSAALPTAQHGDAVWVASGHYLPFIYGVTNTFTMVSGVKLLGGFAGWETTEAQRDPIANETILSCKFEFNPTEFFPGYNVIYCAGTDSSTLIDGFRIFNMQAGPINGEDCDIDQHKCYGGGIFLYSPSPDTSTFLTIANCRFIESNCCEAGGGAIGVNFSEGSGGFTIKHCTFKKNHAIEGGALHIVIGPLQQLPMLVDSCNFEENSAQFVGVGSVYNYNLNADFTFSNCLFLKNKAKNNGGMYIGAELGAKPLMFSNCAFVSNLADAGLTSGSGGALSGHNIHVKNCIFQKNSAGKGGAMNIDYLRAENCLFIGNHSKRRGGAVSCYISNYFTNCAFINNITDSLGAGGIDAGGIGISKDTILNCIFIGNKNNGESSWMSTYGANQYVANTYIDTENCETARLGFAPTDSLTCGPNMFFNIDPMLRDTANGDYRLAGCSPLLDQGDGAWVARFGLYKDYDGNDRWQGAAPDIGAFETPRFGAVGNWQDALCYGSSDGEISLLPQGGFAPYTYAWSDGTSGSFRDMLPAGGYQVTVSDADHCNKALQITIAEPDALQVVASITPSNNMPLPNGAIMLDSVSGGTMPYTYKWENGSIGTKLEGLAEGTYTVTITDSQGCTISASFEVPFVVATNQPINIRVGISPNPSTGLIRISIPLEAAPLSLEISDVLGRLRHTQSLRFSENNVSLIGLEPGMLTLVFRRDGRIVDVQQVVLR